MCDKFSPRGWGGRCPAYAVRVPRPYRFEVPGGIFHVATRSVHEKQSFGGVDDRTGFLDILGTVVDACGWLCKSYCLMGSHYHLIIQTPVPNLSGGMQLLNGKYAQRFNWRDGRRGHLFGGRFYSVLIETDAHLFAALRYVALNPVKAGLCETPAGWRWSSFRSTAGLAPAPRFLDCAGVLALFGTGRAGRREFRRFVESVPTEEEFQLIQMDGI